MVAAHDASQASGWPWPSLLVAALALLFTVGSFWYLNARQGRLRCYEPHSFAAAVSGFVLFLRFPLVLHNTGAKPIVVQDLQLRFPDEPNALLPLPWRTSRAELMPRAEDGHKMPAAFAIPGRAAEQHFVEFGGPFPGLTLAARDYRLRIEARLGHRKGWRPLLDFTLRAGHIHAPAQYLTYSNSPVDLSEEDKQKANAALEVLMSELWKAKHGDEAPPMPRGPLVPLHRPLWKRLLRRK